MTKSQYRVLVVLSFLIGIVAGGFDYLFPTLVPDGARELLEQDVSGSPDWLVILLGLLAMGFVVVALAASYGLYMFRRWAPPLAVFTTACSIVVAVIGGATVYSGPASALLYTCSYLWGAALLIPYLSEYRAWFSVQPLSQPEGQADDWPSQKPGD